MLFILHNWSKRRKYLPLSGLFHRVHCTQIWWYYFSLTIFHHRPFSAHHCPSCQHWCNQSSPSPFSWNSWFHIFGNTKWRHSWVEENIMKCFKLKEHYTVKIKIVEIKKAKFQALCLPVSVSQWFLWYHHLSFPLYFKLFSTITMKVPWTLWG